MTLERQNIVMPEEVSSGLTLRFLAIATIRTAAAPDTITRLLKMRKLARNKHQVLVCEPAIHL